MFEWIPGWLWWLLTLYACIPLVCYVIFPYLAYGNRSTRKRVIICVLGDLGHSPRMCYHARSFSSSGWQVELCGLVEEMPPADIIDDPRITIHQLRTWIPDGKPRTFAVVAMLKVISQIGSILKTLWELRGSDYMVVQNPPSIPILPIAAVYSLVSGCKLIVDWHNLGYTILELKLGSSWHPLVVIVFLVEWFFAKWAHAHLTVTKAMEKFLVGKFGVSKKRIAVLCDRPARQFRPLEKPRAVALQQPFVHKYLPKGFDASSGDQIIVTSTSFTPDEDLSVLIGALKIYENSYKKFDASLPRILCFITGKGPLKSKYEHAVKREKWDRVTIEFVWLTTEDYPKLLQLCDFGVSLHTSSSGLDLPMKILDMFGSAIPVVAYNYPVLDELVAHNRNGLKFMDRRELHEALIFMVKDKNVREVLKDGARKESANRWEQSWETAMHRLKVVSN
ncbi:LAMI_0E10088g1_1 [Lachancea mirantina]|uniref:Chitobiosyldiphosphodolichol beta-mannosyltransferase n=1 Tax=Lachancea mirantina TaxID=1230905 RepID=A0A1G4JPB6_9SACH|nr:LAMI_0E10088g1_1 [Lachancea mirantina]